MRIDSHQHFWKYNPARNVQWHEDHFDPELLPAVRRALAPVMNKQWDYDAAVDRLKMNALEGAPK